MDPHLEDPAFWRDFHVTFVPVAPDPDIFVDLARVFAIAYERGRYDKSIDYSKPLTD